MEPSAVGDTNINLCLREETLPICSLSHVHIRHKKSLVLSVDLLCVQGLYPKEVVYGTGRCSVCTAVTVTEVDRDTAVHRSVYLESSD